jgi:ubiquinone/menaquinone biosynthesis C-methylase UbiE
VTDQIRFQDGGAYEDYMGKWSQLAGSIFLDWLAPQPGLRWLDVGCGNGAFTEMVADRCAPASIDGVDPSEAQLDFARTRPALRAATFHQGDAMALPFPDHSFDVAVMPLVIFFVPDPAKGVAEMARVVGPGGMVTAYAWDVIGRGFPYVAVVEELQALGQDVPQPPSNDASRMDVLTDLWTRAGLRDLQTREITVERTFASFDEYWPIIHGSPSASKRLTGMSDADRAMLQSRLRERLPADAEGRITYAARANAIQGQKGRH